MVANTNYWLSFLLFLLPSSIVAENISSIWVKGGHCLGSASFLIRMIGNCLLGMCGKSWSLGSTANCTLFFASSFLICTHKIPLWHFNFLFAITCSITIFIWYKFSFVQKVPILFSTLSYLIQRISNQFYKCEPNFSKYSSQRDSWESCTYLIGIVRLYYSLQTWVICSNHELFPILNFDSFHIS